MVDDVLQAVAQACRGVEGLQAALVFGSVLERDDPGDLDVALLWDEAIPRERRWRLAVHEPVAPPPGKPGRRDAEVRRAARALHGRAAGW